MSDKHHQCVIVGIAGASASGKSLIASTLYRELRDQVGDEHIGVIPEDCYYKDQSHMTMEERVKTNYDHPQRHGPQFVIPTPAKPEGRAGH
ncbi:Uridine kinase [Ewingella americana]|uniref:Uridine kinase n=1 Tax=Ewingella americana TaxID=41202 RepID=A0A377NE09_9GAMM|nr:Uridine kinase [Ewingella americana]